MGKFIMALKHNLPDADFNRLDAVELLYLLISLKFNLPYF